MDDVVGTGGQRDKRAAARRDSDARRTCLRGVGSCGEGDEDNSTVKAAADSGDEEPLVVACSRKEYVSALEEGGQEDGCDRPKREDTSEMCKSSKADNEEDEQVVERKEDSSQTERKEIGPQAEREQASPRKDRQGSDSSSLNTSSSSWWRFW